MSAYNGTKAAVLLLNYNNAVDTLEALQSLKSCTGKFDIVFIDNGSTDDSVTRIVSYVLTEDCFVLVRDPQQLRVCGTACGTDERDVIILESPCNCGFSGGFNLGIGYCIQNDYKYAILANNDLVFVDATTIQKILKVLDGLHPDIGVLGVRNITPEGSYISDSARKGPLSIGTQMLTSSIFRHLFPASFRRKITYEDERDNKKYSEVSSMRVMPVHAISGALMAFEVDVLKEVGGLDDRLFFNLEEYALTMALQRIGKTMYYCDDIYVTHKVGGTKKSMVGFAYMESRKSEFIYFRDYLNYGMWRLGLLMSMRVFEAIILSLISRKAICTEVLRNYWILSSNKGMKRNI